MAGRSELLYYVRLVRGRRKKLRLDLTNRVTSFTFEDNERKADKLSIQVDNWDLKNFDTPVWAKGNELEVSWGYIGNMSPARQVTITKVTGSTTLKVEGVSKTFVMDRVPRSAVYEDMKRSDVVKQIAESYGYGEDSYDITETEEVLQTISQPSITDAAMLRRLANKEGFEFYVDFDGFHWHKRRTEQAPSREYTWYNDRTGTLKSFNIDNDITVRPGFVQVKGRDLLNKKDYITPILGEATVLAASPEDFANANATANALVYMGKQSVAQIKPFTNFGSGLLDAAAKQSGKAEIKSSSEPSEKAAKGKASGELRRRKQLTVKMSAKVIGDPGLIAKTVLRIAGIGERLSGNYYLKSVKHVITGSGYDCALKMIRDGHNASSVKLFHQRQGRGGGGKIDSNGSCEAYVAMELGITKTLWSVWSKEGKTYDPYEEVDTIAATSKAINRILANAKIIEGDAFNAAASYRIFQDCLKVKGLVRPNGPTFKEVAALQMPSTLASSRCNIDLNNSLGEKAANDDRAISSTRKVDVYGRQATQYTDKTTGVVITKWLDKRGRK